MQQCKVMRMAAAGDSAGFLPSDLNLRYFGDPEERILYVQDVPGTWDKWKLFHVFRRFGRIDNIILPKESENSTFTHAFVHMMSIADARTVITATAENNGKLFMPELVKPLRIRLMNHKKKNDLADADGDAHVQKVKSYFSVERTETGAERNVREPILYVERIHRHVYLPWGMQVQVRVVKPITEPLRWPLIFYVNTKKNVYEAGNVAVSNEEFENQLMAHFKRAKGIKHVVINELLVTAPKKLGQPPLRCRVLEELEKNRVRVYALDVGHTLEVNISELKVISDYLASIPARAIPCALFGISKPTDAFPKVATHLLESLDRIGVRVMSFKGATAFVKAYRLDESPVKEIAKILAAEGVCEYDPPEKKIVYSRETILSLRKDYEPLHIENPELAMALQKCHLQGR